MEEDIDIKWLEEYAEQEKKYKWGKEIKKLIKRNKELEEKLQDKTYKFLCDNPYIDTFDIREVIMLEEVQKDYIPKSKVREKIEILEKCTTNINRKVNLTDYMIIGETERATGRFVNLDFIKKALLEEPGYDIKLLQEGDK